MIDGLVRIAGRRNQIVLEKVERPNRGSGDHSGARGIADRQHDAVWGRGVDIQNEPALRQTVVTDPRPGQKSSVSHRGEEIIDHQIQNAVGHARGLIEGTQLAIYRDDELRGANGAHGVGRKRQGVVQGGAVKAESGRLGGEHGFGPPAGVS